MESHILHAKASWNSRMVREQGNVPQFENFDNEVVARVIAYLQGNKKIGFRSFELNLENDYFEALKVINRTRISECNVMLFFCGRKFDQNSNLKVIPVDVIFHILKMKFYPVLSFPAFHVEVMFNYIKGYFEMSSINDIEGQLEEVIIDKERKKYQGCCFL